MRNTTARRDDTGTTRIQLDALSGLFPHRVARAEELIGLGVPGRSVYRRCEPGGPWQRVLPGVLVLGTSPPTPTQLVQAALRYAEPDAVLTGPHALVLHGMRSVPPIARAPVHVLVPKQRALRGSPRLIVERTTRMPKPQACKGFLIAPLERALLDTVRQFNVVEQVRPLLDEAVWRLGVPPNLISTEMASGTSRGTALPRRVLTEVVNGVRTEAQALAAVLIRNCKLSRPQWNMQIDDGDNAYLGPVSAWWDEVAVALDIDMDADAPDRAISQRIDRNSVLTSAGVIVVHTSPRRLRHRPAEFVEQLRRAHQWASSRDRPPVTASAQHPRRCGAR
jgi:hypothetical protein